MNWIRDRIELIKRPLQSIGNPLNSMPDFANMIYKYAVAPQGATLDAWAKLMETERRWVFLRWAEGLNDPRAPRHRIVLDDALASYLLSFEATIQYVKTAFARSSNRPDFEQWIRAQPGHDLLVRGLRTLRHHEAHIWHLPVPSLIKAFIGGSLPDGTSTTNVTRIWRLPKIDDAMLRRVSYPKIDAAEIPDWNMLVEGLPAQDLIESSLGKLAAILTTAESEIQAS